MRPALFFVLVTSAGILLAAASSWNDALVVDEVAHVAAGYSYLVHADMRLNPEHPPLAKVLAALPLVFMDLDRRAFEGAPWRDESNPQWVVGRLFLFGSGNDADAIRRWARAPMLLLYVASAALLWSWARWTLGTRGAAIALVLFCFSPTVLAHSRFVTTDVAALLGVLWTLYSFFRWLEAPTPRRTAHTVVALGMALLLKFSTVLLIPYLIAVALLHRRTVRAALHAAAIAAASFVLVVCPVYLWLTWSYPPEKQRLDTVRRLALVDDRRLAGVAIALSDTPVLRAPAHYLLGLLAMSHRAQSGGRIFFLGRVARSAGPLYFPLVYLLKEPLAWWLLVGLAAAVWWRRRAPAIPHAGYLFLWIALYWSASLAARLNVGVRHLLPTYPFAILLVSGALAPLVARANGRRLARGGVAVVLLLAVYAAESTLVYPSYLAYFNPLAGGPAGGHRYVGDSNLDWGQDLIRLRDWMNAHGVPKIELDYFGQSDPRYYLGDRHVPLTSRDYKHTPEFLALNQTGGWIAVSANQLLLSTAAPDTPVLRSYAWLRKFPPAAVVGHSIFVWHITSRRPAAPAE